jgi:ABC-type methionine transport system permease subunit
MFDHFGAFALVQVVLAVGVIFSAVMFLRLKSWARASLEAMSWLILLFGVVFGVYWAIFWYGSFSAGPQSKGAIAQSYLFRDFGVVMAAIITVMNSVPFAVLIWWLRKSTVREACSR